MKDIALRQLLDAGCHFGHKTNKWHPKAAPYIYKAISGIHIIDLVKTKEFLEKAGEFVAKTAASGGEVVFVGTKRQAHAIIKREASRVGAPYMSERWIGGFITNWSEVKKNIDKMQDLRNQLANEKKRKAYTKRERLLIERDIKKLEALYGGAESMEKNPDALFIIDIKKEFVAVREAVARSIPIVAIVDTNTNPIDIDYPIPSNDDAVGSIMLITKYIADAYEEGKQERKAAKDKEKKSAKDASLSGQKTDNDEKKKTKEAKEPAKIKEG